MNYRRALSEERVSRHPALVETERNKVERSKLPRLEEGEEGQFLEALFSSVLKKIQTHREKRIVRRQQKEAF